LFLSNVRICSNNITESLSSLYLLFSISTCVGILALLILPVIAATITVGLYLLPVSFCIMTTGHIPPCSEPCTGDKSAKYAAPLFIYHCYTYKQWRVPYNRKLQIQIEVLPAQGRDTSQPFANSLLSIVVQHYDFGFD